MLKVFRLFISSTFSDFIEERNCLQAEVFPEINRYCEERGFSFQPVDLRWGVNDELQLDQKTLELCLSEVRQCKRYPHPNFLIMIGDRYGWVPLPYIIEQKVFKKLIKVININDLKLLNDWYELD